MDTMSMFEMWTAGTMLASVCTRVGKAGIHENMGKCSHVCGHGEAQLLKPSLSLYREERKAIGLAR